MIRHLLLSLGLAACAWGLAAEKSRLFVVKEVKGRVLAWEPWANHWSEVEPGMKLPEATLVQVGHDSTFSFDIAADQGFKGIHAESARVRINRPTVLRLDETVLRNVTLNSYFISKFPDITVATKFTKGKDVLGFELSEAWKRFAAILAKDNKSRSINALNLSGAPAQDADVAVRSKKIQIYTPPDGTTVIPERLPLSLTVSWEKIPEPDVEYELSVWKTDTTRGSPIAVTPSDYYLVKLPTNGSYYVQVAALDGRWQSSVHRVDVASPLALSAPAKPRATPPARVPLLLPPRDFTYVSAAFPTLVSFRWEDEGSTVRKPLYEFVLVDKEGKELTRTRVDHQVVSVPFGRPGDFRWHVEALLPRSQAGDIERLSSETRDLHLKPVDALFAEPTPDPLAQLLESGGSRVVYLDRF